MGCRRASKRGFPPRRPQDAWEMGLFHDVLEYHQDDAGE